VPPHAWVRQSGALPAGLTLSAGEWSAGHRPPRGTSYFTAKSTDALGGTASKQFAIAIAANPVITTASPLPNGEVNAAYSQNLEVTGGIWPYTWIRQSGALPAGLTVDAGGTISGTPQATGKSTATLRVTDSYGAVATKQLSITIITGVAITTNAALPVAETGIAYVQNWRQREGQRPMSGSWRRGIYRPGYTSIPRERSTERRCRREQSVLRLK